MRSRRNRSLRRVAAVATAPLMLFLGIALAPPAHATFAGGNGLVAFVTTRSGSPQIWTVDPTSGTEHPLSDGTGVDTSPAWSPFGTRLAFARGADVWTMKADGTGPVDLTSSDPLTDSQPAWSPDGKKIVFVSDRDTAGRTQIYVMQSNGSRVVRLTNDSGSDSDPQWSPDGTRIVFVSNRDGNSEIYSMRPSGGGPRNLTLNTAADASPSWSPDSAHIVFTSGRSRAGSVGADIWIMNANGSDPVPLQHESNGYSDGADATFSPDGTQIVLSANNGQGSQQLWLVPSGGGQNTRLTNETGNHTSSDWQPMPPAATLAVHPRSGAVGRTLTVQMNGFAPGERVHTTFSDSAKHKTAEPICTTDGSGACTITLTVPVGAAPGRATIAATGATSLLVARKAFTVT